MFHNKLVQCALGLMFLFVLAMASMGWAMFAPPPMDNPYCSKTMMNDEYVPGPTYGYDHNSGIDGNGDNWSEASATGFTLKDQYHINDMTNEYGGVNLVLDASSEFMQQFVATQSAQTFNLAWNGTMSANENIQLIYELTWNSAQYDPDTDDWRWQYVFSPYLDYQTVTGENKEIDETCQLNFNFAPGTKFALWIYQSVGSGWHTSTGNTQIVNDGNFYNSFTITNYSGAEAVPIPGAVWLLGSSLIGLVAIRRKRG